MSNKSPFAAALIISCGVHAVALAAVVNLSSTLEQQKGDESPVVFNVSFGELPEPEQHTTLVETATVEPPSPIPVPKREVLEAVMVKKEETPKKKIVKTEASTSAPKVPRPETFSGKDRNLGSGVTTQALVRAPIHRGGPGVPTLDASLLGINPSYPRYARQRGQEGRAVVKVTVEASGNASNVALNRSSGFSVLDEAALDAARAARFSSAGGESNRQVLVAFNFRLEG